MELVLTEETLYQRHINCFILGIEGVQSEHWGIVVSVQTTVQVISNNLLAYKRDVEQKFCLWEFPCYL